MSKQSLPLIGATSTCEVAPLAREPLSADSAAEPAGVFKALSDPVRLRLLSLVASRVGAQACVCELSEAFDLTQLSQLLRIATPETVAP
ncbi:ArsR/SmtB family transcription factor [Nocardia lijiangensis]|uniref:ArsR/SmtB family transcription factor n=1 Tax=Nocardia lijiangensis TaxID=299618 RepID=UPI003D72E6FA